MVFFLLFLSDFPRLKTLLGATRSIAWRIDSKRISSSSSRISCSSSEYTHSDKLCSPKVLESDETSEDEEDIDDFTFDDLGKFHEDEDPDDALEEAEEDDIDDTLEDDDSSSSWQPLSMTALAFLLIMSDFVILVLSCSRSGAMLVI